MKNRDLEEIMAKMTVVRATEPSGAPWETKVFEQLLIDIRAERDEIERLGHVPPAMIEKLKSAGIYRAMTAKRFGGDEMSPADFCRMIEAISAADGSTG